MKRVILLSEEANYDVVELVPLGGPTAVTVISGKVRSQTTRSITLALRDNDSIIIDRVKVLWWSRKEKKFKIQ